VFGVSPLLRALIIEAATLQDEPDDAGYAGRAVHLIVDQLRRAQPLPAALPWPRQVATLCEALYDEPDNQRGPQQGGPCSVCRRLGFRDNAALMINRIIN
jgi:hypothetical protein